MWESHKDRIMSLGTMVSEDNEIYPVKTLLSTLSALLTFYPIFCVPSWRVKCMVWE